MVAGKSVFEQCFFSKLKRFFESTIKVFSLCENRAKIVFPGVILCENRFSCGEKKNEKKATPVWGFIILITPNRTGRFSFGFR